MPFFDAGASNYDNEEMYCAKYSQYEKEIAMASLLRCAALMWESRATGYRKMLWIACLRRRSMGAVLMAVFSSMGLSWAIWQHFMELRYKTGSHE